MKKKIFTLLIILSAITTGVRADVEINSTNFPDDFFRAYVKQILQKDGNSTLSADEIAQVKEITADNNSIKTLKGIEFFTALQVLKCTGNKSLTSLDLSKNVNMRELYCSDCSLTSLTVAAGAYNFKTINCCLNQLRGDKMKAFLNSLPFLMMYGLTAQLYLIDGDDLNEGNEMVDLGWYTSLISKGWYSWGHVLDNWYDYASFYQLMTPSISIDSNFPDANFRKAVKEKCDLNKDGYLSIAEVTKVKELFVYNMGIGSLKGVEIFTELQTLSCYYNSISSLDVTKNTKLRNLIFGSNEVSSIDLSKNTALKHISCYDNKLTSLNVSNCPDLDYLDCMYNRLTSLDVSKNTKLVELICSGNGLTSLDLSKNTALEKLNCDDNKLTSLNLTNNKKLKKLDCSLNKINSTEMGKLVNSLPKLEGSRGTFIPCYPKTDDNVITSSQVSVAREKNWNVKVLVGGDYEDYDGQPEGIAIDEINFPDPVFRAYVKNNCQSDGDDILTDAEIAAVKVIAIISGTMGNPVSDLTGIGFFTELEMLFCFNNNLTTIDLSNNKKLKELICNNNQIKGEGMDQLITSLHDTGGKLEVIAPYISYEGNEITAEQVAAANKKNWKVYYWTTDDPENGKWAEYDPTGIEDITRDPITNNRYYSLDGHRIEGVPTQKGVYIRNGQKVVVK